MDRANSFILAILLAACPVSHSSVGVPDTVGPVPWSSESYTAELPPPFGTVRIELSIKDNVPVAFKVHYGERVIEATREQLEALSEPTIDSITYAPVLGASEKAEYIEILVLTGESYKIRNKPCGDLQNFTWERDFASFRIDTEAKMTRRLNSFRQMDACGT
jgi:hypothetical protein